MSKAVDETLEQLGLTYPEQGVVSLQEPDRWEDSLITGSGTIGVLVPGGRDKEILTFSHERLFMPIAPPHGPVPLAPHLEKVRAMLDREEWGKASEFLVELGTANGVLGHTWTDPFVSAFQLSLDLDGPAEQAGAYARSVDYRSALATVAWREGSCICRREAFASRPDRVALVRLSKSDGKISCRLGLRLLPPDDEKSTEYVDQYVESFQTATTDDGFLTCETRYKLKWDGSIKGCAGAVRVVTDGKVKAEGDTLRIENAGEVLLIVGVELMRDLTGATQQELKKHLLGTEPDFDALLRRHAEVHGALYDRTHLELANELPNDSSEEMLKASDMGRLSPALAQRLFDAGRYAVICSTGELPPALQGIWSGTWSAAWSGDFTLNGNVQAAVACGMMAGIPEGYLTFCDYLETLMDDFRKNARDLFNARGIMVPSRTSTHGLEIHFRVTCPMSYWTAGGAWAAAFFYDYWRYTQDRDFLVKRAVPFMLEAAALYEDFIYLDKQGKVTFNPSYSPENVSPNAERPASVNATMDFAVVRELFGNLLTLKNKVELPPERVARWQELMDAMPEYQIDDEGAFKEWMHPKLTENHNHRHASHLYPLYHVPDPAVISNPALVEACKTSIERRLEYRRGKNGAEMAFGIVQLGLAATNLKDNARTNECIEWLCNRYWTTALSSLHDPNKIFNTDISGGLPAVMVQTILLSRDHEMELLPCLPDAWKNGSARGLGARGGFGLDIDWADHKLKSVTIRSKVKQTCRVICGDKRVELTFEAGEEKKLDGSLSE